MTRKDYRKLVTLSLVALHARKWVALEEMAVDGERLSPRESRVAWATIDLMSTMVFKALVQVLKEENDNFDEFKFREEWLKIREFSKANAGDDRL